MTRAVPDISVVVPTYRRPDLLPRLIAAMEAQTLPYDRFEVVVVDDGSGDETAAVLEQLAASTPVQLRPLTGENHGPASARNRGWREARAAIVAFTDDDCTPEPQWLEWGLKAIERDEHLGIVQGCVLQPKGRYDYTRWTAFREVVGPTPWFEASNLFLRRAALEDSGGFEERISFMGEDTWLGWSVLASGWGRDFERSAVVRHDRDERGVWYHVRMAWKEGALVAIAADFPALRHHGFWRPWAVRPLNVAFAVGVVGTVLAVARRPRLLLLWLPWVAMRRPPFGTAHWTRYMGERFLVDASVFAGMKVAAVKHRRFVL